MMRAFLTGAVMLMAFGLGCASDSEPDTWNASQRRALDDPMNYRPEMNTTDVSGGEIHEFDRKGFKRDLDLLLMN